MKISYNWLKNYVNFDWMPEELADRLTMAGLEVEGIEKVESIPGGLSGIVVGEVKDVSQHPNADKLRLCKIDVGQENLLSIVCGAPNIALGQKVPVATIGTTMYPKDHDPFKIKKSKIRGELSEGMICAEDELGLGDDHDGIMILESQLTPGTPANEVFDLKPDYVLEIGLTANRADATGHFGVSRDIAALLRNSAKLPQLSIYPDSDKIENPVSVTIDDNDKCPRYAGIYISGIEVKQSPEWMQEALTVIGLRPINNIVDITNYVMHETGQPMHAFDASRIQGNKIIVKTLQSDSKFSTLDEVERTIRKEKDLMICDAEGPVAIAGVMGGLNSEVEDATTDIYLECAYFHPGSIRQTAKSAGVSTDASYRFERGADPNIIPYAIQRAADLILELAGGKASEIDDNGQSEFPPMEIKFNVIRANQVMGTDFSSSEIIDLLASLEIKASETEQSSLLLKVPPYRVDVTRQQDVMEEILRIHGYNNVPFSGKTSISLISGKGQDKHELLNRYFSYLSGSGLQEILTNSLIASIHNSDTSVAPINALSEEIAVLRESMLIPALDVISHNLNRGLTDLRLYENGKTYTKSGEAYSETNWIAYYFSGKTAPENWRSKTPEIDFFTLKAEIEKMAAWFGINGTFETGEAHPDFDYLLEFKEKDTIIARVGQAKASLCARKGIDQAVYLALVNADTVLDVQRPTVRFREIPKLPGARRDISMVVPESIPFSRIKDLIISCNPKLIREVNITDVYKGEHIEQGFKSYLVNLFLLDEQKSLKDKQVDKLMQRIFNKLESDLNISIRK